MIRTNDFDFQGFKSYLDILYSSHMSFPHKNIPCVKTLRTIHIILSMQIQRKRFS